MTPEKSCPFRDDFNRQIRLTPISEEQSGGLGREYKDAINAFKREVKRESALARRTYVTDSYKHVKRKRPDCGGTFEDYHPDSVQDLSCPAGRETRIMDETVCGLLQGQHDETELFSMRTSPDSDQRREMEDSL